MHPFDIHYAKFPWNGCVDERPWLIVEVRPGGRFGCVPISGRCYQGNCFALDQHDPDFGATGLTKSCHVHDVWIYELEAADFTRRIGSLTGSLLSGFRAYSGL